MRATQDWSIRKIILAILVAVATVYYFQVQAGNPERIYVYSTIQDDDDPSPNAVLKTDVTDRVKHQVRKAEAFRRSAIYKSPTIIVGTRLMPLPTYGPVDIEEAIERGKE